MKMPLNRLALVMLFALASYMAWDYQDKLLADKGRLKISQSQIIPGAVEFSWSTEIKVPMEQRFIDGFNKWRDKTDHFIISLHSPGGALREGRKVIEVIKQMKKTHKVDTYVGPQRACLSMCPPIFLQGQNRIAHSSSVWMFHEPSSVDFFTDKKLREPEFERRAMVRRFVDRYFVNSPIDPKWRKKLLQAWKGKDIWASGAQLVAEKSNIITRME